jgi:hypothetical protein
MTMLTTHKNRLFIVLSSILTLLSFQFLKLTQGLLVGTLGIERQTALAIVAAIEAGGLWYAAAVYPMLAPFVGTVQGILAIMGISAVVGF